MTRVLRLENPASTERTLGEALCDYFATNGFGQDGGYSAAWVDFHLGPIPMPFPNTAARKRAVPRHDLHHILTGYRTDVAGEFEISAWEIGGGCRDFVAAWQLNLGGMAGGVLRWPSRTWRAFVRGRHSRNLYDRPYDAALLSTSVSQARRDLGLDTAPPRATLGDVALFAVALSAGVLVGLVTLVLFAPLALVAAPVLAHMKRAHDRRAPSVPSVAPGA